MNRTDALAKLEALGKPIFENSDIAALLGVTRTNANKLATRLAASSFLVRLARGRWALSRRVNRLQVPEELVAPYPAYISLQTALYHHGVISQIPSVVYAVSLARTRRFETALGVFSIHHVSADFFFGFERDMDGIAMAIPEKALLDMLYLSPTRTRLFRSLPELEIPRSFRWKLFGEMAKKIKSRMRRHLVETRMNELRYKKTRKRLAPLEGIARGERGVKKRRLVGHSEAKKRMARWLR